MDSSASARNSCSTTCARCLRRLEWDELLHASNCESIRLVFMPIVNPGGMWARTRSNPNGVDLMRNAPQSAEGRVPFLAGGQRIGPWLPWYRGRGGAPMEVESAALLSVVEKELIVAAAQLRARLPFGLTAGTTASGFRTRAPSGRCRICRRCSC